MASTSTRSLFKVHSGSYWSPLARELRHLEDAEARCPSTDIRGRELREMRRLCPSTTATTNAGVVPAACTLPTRQRRSPCRRGVNDKRGATRASIASLQAAWDPSVTFSERYVREKAGQAGASKDSSYDIAQIATGSLKMSSFILVDS